MSYFRDLRKCRVRKQDMDELGAFYRRSGNFKGFKIQELEPPMFDMVNTREDIKKGSGHDDGCGRRNEGCAGRDQGC